MNNITKKLVVLVAGVVTLTSVSLRLALVIRKTQMFLMVHII